MNIANMLPSTNFLFDIRSICQPHGVEILFVLIYIELHLKSCYYQY